MNGQSERYFLVFSRFVIQIVQVNLSQINSKNNIVANA